MAVPRTGRIGGHALGVKQVPAEEWGGCFEPDAATLAKIREIDFSYAWSARSQKPFCRRSVAEKSRKRGMLLRRRPRHFAQDAGGMNEFQLNDGKAAMDGRERLAACEETLHERGVRDVKLAFGQTGEKPLSQVAADVADALDAALSGDFENLPDIDESSVA
jgi:hypothetical protein